MLSLANPKRPELEPVQAEALVDTGSDYLVLPEVVRRQLQLEELERRQVVLADGSRKSVPYVGPVQLSFKNRGAFVGALVMGDQVLLGAIPMEDMDLILQSAKRTADVNPASPDIATGLAKGFSHR